MDKMDKMASDSLAELIWEEIAVNLAREEPTGDCLCADGGFHAYLTRNARLPFGLELLPKEGFGGIATGKYALILGWRVLGTRAAGEFLGGAYRTLAAGGKAYCFGFCRSPSRDDLIIWKQELRQRLPGASIPFPLPGAASLSSLVSRVTTTPFERYSIRKKGICYQVYLSK